MRTDRERRLEMAARGTCRGPGRPVVPLFISDEVEEDFCRRARLAIATYFDVTDPYGKKPWKLPGGVQMGCAAFWVHVFRFYTSSSTLERPRKIFPEIEEPLMRKPLWTRIEELLTEVIGRRYIADRTGMDRHYQSIEQHWGQYAQRLANCHPSPENVIEKDRRFSSAVVASWSAL